MSKTLWGPAARYSAAALTLLMALSSGAQAGPLLVDRWSFANGGTDSVGSADLTMHGAANVSGGVLNLPGGHTQTDFAYATGAALTALAATINSATSLTVESWFTDTSGSGVQKVFMAGNSSSSYIDVTPNKSGSNSQEIKTSATSEIDNRGSPVTAVQWYIAANWNSTTNLMTLYSGQVGGTLNTVQTSMGGDLLSSISVQSFMFGGSTFADPDMAGTIAEARLWTGTFSLSDASTNFAAGPNATLTAAPEPAALGMFGFALMGLGYIRYRRSVVDCSAI